MMNKFITFLFLILLLACKKKSSTQNNSQHPVPSIPVQLNIYPNNPLYFKVQAVGGWMYIDNIGLNGVVLYRKSEQEFVAVERTSSQLPNNGGARVKVMPDNFTLRDTVSDSRWRMFDGSVTQGPATWPLRLYGTSYDGNLLKIVN